MQLQRHAGQLLAQQREGVDQRGDLVVGFPGAQAHDVQAVLVLPGRGGEARAVHAPVDLVHRGARLVLPRGLDEAGRVAGEEVGAAQDPAREPAHPGPGVRRHQQVAAPGRHHQRVAVAARGQVAVGGEVVRMHDVGRQRAHMAARRARAQQPVGLALHGCQDALLHAIERLGPRGDEGDAPAACAHLQRPAPGVRAVGVAQQAQVGCVSHAQPLSGANLPPRRRSGVPVRGAAPAGGRRPCARRR